MNANDRQVGGEHYKSKIQHWDYVIANDLDYFQAQITKYVTRWKKKGGVADLEKAKHFLEKYIEAESAKEKKEVSQVYGEMKGTLIQSPLYTDSLSPSIKDRIDLIPSNKATGMKYPFGYEPEDD